MAARERELALSQAASHAAAVVEAIKDVCSEERTWWLDSVGDDAAVQAALHVPLTPAAERTWARLTDGLVLGFLVMIMTWGGLWFFLLRLGGEPLFVVLLFGITRSDCYAARVCARFAELGQYSYAIYIIHPPVIKWAKFTAAARSGNVVVVRRAPEFVRNASPKRENTCEISKKKRRETP